MNVRSPLPNLCSDWKIVHTDGGFHAVDTEGKRVGPDILRDYEIVEYIAEGATSLCYKAISKIDGRVVIIKERYPHSLSVKGYLKRDGIFILRADSLTEEQNQSVDERFGNCSAELQAGSEVRFYMGENSPTNDPRFLPATPAVIKDEALTAIKMCAALNQYQVIDTQAGTFLDQIEFKVDDGRKLIIDKLNLIKQILIALNALHNEKHRIHMDLKPTNILVSLVHVGEIEHWGNHQVMIVDYGSSLSLQDDGHVAVSNGARLSSTIDYAAEEILFCDYSDIGVQSDTYSVFIITHQLLLSDKDVTPIQNLELSYNAIMTSHSPGLSALSTSERRLLRDFLYAGTINRAYPTATSMYEELNKITDVLNGKGVHPAILRQQAQQIGYDVISKNSIDKELLCEVEIV